MKTNRIRKDRADLIIKLWAEGWTQVYIASQVGCHPNSVGRFMRRNGLI
ncbi:MAG: hypothetical protein RPT25_15000 [Cycloclasticus sp.]